MFKNTLHKLKICTLCTSALVNGKRKIVENRAKSRYTVRSINIGISTQFSSFWLYTPHFKWNEQDVLYVQTFSFNLRVFTSKSGERCRNYNSFYMCLPLFKGSKVMGQLAAQLFHGQVCVIPSLSHLQGAEKKSDRWDKDQLVPEWWEEKSIEKERNCSWSKTYHLISEAWWWYCHGMGMYGCQWNWFPCIYWRCDCWQKQQDEL